MSSKLKETSIPTSTGGKIKVIREWLDDNYFIRVNIFDPSQSEISAKTLEYDKAISIDDIYLHMIDDDIACSKAILKTILSSPNQITTFNPIEEYFDQIRGSYKGISHIELYCDHIRARDFEDKPKDYYQLRMKRIVRKWLISVVACVLGKRQNDVALGFICAQGGIGKTSLIHNLMPAQLEEYYQLSDKDERHFKMTECFTNKMIINFDEMNGITPNTIDTYKKNMSARELVIKMPGSTFTSRVPRIGSAAFTSNKNQEMGGFIRNPDSGFMRRLGSVEVVKILDYRSKLDVDQLWAEAVMLAEQSTEAYEWNQEDFSEFQEYNTRYILETTALRLVKEYYRPPLSGEEAEFKMSGDIIRDLRAARKITASMNNITDVTIGQALNMQGYIRTAKKLPQGTRYGYYVIPLY